MSMLENVWLQLIFCVEFQTFQCRYYTSTIVLVYSMTYNYYTFYIILS